MVVLLGMFGEVLVGMCDNDELWFFVILMFVFVFIVVCMYNGECFLQEQFDSLLVQICCFNQIVIWDDLLIDGILVLLQVFVLCVEVVGIIVDLQVNLQNVGY